jgi:hypothetical protein
MPAGSRPLVRAAAVVVIVALAAPAAAFADGGGTCKASACKVYHEQGAPNSGRQQPTKPTTTGSKSGVKQPQPKHYSRVLAQAGADRGALKKLLNGDAAIGNLSSGAGGGSPSILGAAFDLGIGPTVLLAILLATGLGLAARGTVRSWLHKRSSS